MTPREKQEAERATSASFCCCPERADLQNKAGQPDPPRLLKAPLAHSREQQIFKPPLVLVLELQEENSFVMDEGAARPGVSMRKKMEVMVQERTGHSSLALPLCCVLCILGCSAKEMFLKGS